MTCAVAYRLEYQGAYDDPDAPDVYALYRKIERADTTFHALLGRSCDANSPQLELDGLKQASGASVPAKNQSSGSWVEDEILTEAENYLVSNIVDFKYLSMSRNDGTATGRG